PPAGADGRLAYGGIELDERAHRVLRDGRPVPLSPTEFRLLRYLMHHSGKVLPKAELLKQVWGYDFAGETSLVETYVFYLRRKIDTVEPRLIHNVRGVGYVLRVAGT
ncbi:MAG: winged helix-turn-helix domain-containing protein, partial [Stackebrandtia sp.]